MSDIEPQSCESKPPRAKELAKKNYWFRGFRLPRYTLVPDELFDEIAPNLTEGELRVLLYIVRRTYGFKKESDNISLRQMVEGIVKKDGERLDHGAGIARSAASRAVQGLVEKGIIEARRNVSIERGDEPTTYTLRWQGDTPEFFKGTRGGPLKEPQGVLESDSPPVLQKNPQDPALQQTENKKKVQQRGATFVAPSSRRPGTDKSDPERFIKGKFGHLVQH